MLHHSLNLKMLMNLIPISFPMGTTWRLPGSSASKPTKQPAVVLEGVAIMFGGISVRIGWPLARKVEAWRVMEGAMLSWRRPDSVKALFFVGKIGAMLDFQFSVAIL